jgi:V8-like Glu-specific endopeptidase
MHIELFNLRQEQSQPTIETVATVTGYVVQTDGTMWEGTMEVMIAMQGYSDLTYIALALHPPRRFTGRLNSG